jgi:hypothetical protein
MIIPTATQRDEHQPINVQPDSDATRASELLCGLWRRTRNVSDAVDLVILLGFESGQRRLRP